MIKCNNDNKEELLAFLLKNPTENCFFIGDIENFDLDDNFIDVWKFEEKNQITSILLRYYKFYLVSAAIIGNLQEIVEIIGNDKECLSVSGLEETIDKLSDFLHMEKIKRTFLAELSGDTFKILPSDVFPLKATADDLDDLFEFMKSIEEFSVTEKNRDSFGKEIISDTGKIYYIRHEGKIVSSTTITAENSVNGTIIGVATDINYRNRGYAKACMIEICREMVAEGKTVVLFYNNSDAGKLYKSIGFDDVGKWAMGSLC